MKREEVNALFTLAGLTPLRMEALIDGYGYPADDPRYFETLPRKVWWFVKTQYGWIKIGWRSSVISINWEDTPLRKSQLTTDCVTKDVTFVHAYSIEKALEYLKEIKRLLDNLTSKC